MKVFKTLTILLMAICLLTVSAFAANLQDDISVRAKVDGDTIEPNAINRVSFERGDLVDIEIRLNSSINLSDVEIMAIVSGYEFNNLEPMSDTSNIFDVESDVSYKKTLTIRIPVEVEEDNYKLRLIISDRFSTIGTYDYNLKLDSPRHGFQIEDVVFSPGTVLQAGRALLTTVRVENKGERDEESVKISVSVPELGITASDFIDEVEYEDAETSEEMYMRIPVCAEPGDYNAVIEVKYNELREAIYENAIITILEGDACTIAQSDAEDKPKTIISLGATTQNVIVGEAGALYPLTITNEGNAAKAYTIEVDGADDFASVQINPTSTFIVNADDSQAVFIYLTANDDAKEGQQIFTITVKSGNEVLKQIPLTADVTAGDDAEAEEEASNFSLRNALEVGLIVLVVILVILGIVVGIGRMKKDDEFDDEEEVEGKTYY